ncbi:MAG: 6,7-dimethyl-8-ribityllumazine synthase [Kiloniellaceae bacterium]
MANISPDAREGSTRADGLRVAIIVSRYNENVSSRLLAGALEARSRSGAAADDVEVYKVPGAWELPIIAKRLAATGRYDGIVALGCVVRGGTPHFDYVAGAASQGLARVMLDHEVALALGVLTCDTMAQALARAGGDQGNKGAEAALCAVEMANLLKRAGKAD